MRSARNAQRRKHQTVLRFLGESISLLVATALIVLTLGIIGGPMLW